MILALGPIERLAVGMGGRSSWPTFCTLRLVFLVSVGLALCGCASISSKVYVSGAAYEAGAVKPLSKKIVVFFDGTNNDETADTNVKRLHSLVTLRPPVGRGAMPRLATI